jgi:hypothetical protein
MGVYKFYENWSTETFRKEYSGWKFGRGQPSARIKVLDDKEEGSIYSDCNLSVLLIEEGSAYPSWTGRKLSPKF